MVRIRKQSSAVRQYELECNLGYGRKTYLLQVKLAGKRDEPGTAELWLAEGVCSVFVAQSGQTDLAEKDAELLQRLLVRSEAELRLAARKLHELTKVEKTVRALPAKKRNEEGAIYAGLLKLSRDDFICTDTVGRILLADSREDVRQFILNAFSNSMAEFGTAYVVRLEPLPAEVDVFAYGFNEEGEETVSGGFGIVLCQGNAMADWLMETPKEGPCLLLIRNEKYIEVITPEDI